MVSKFYKGRLDIVSAMELPISLTHYLYYLAIEKSKTDEGKAELEAEAMAEVMGGGMI